MPAYAVIGLNSAAGDVGWQTALAALARPEDVDAFATSFWVILGILGIAGPLVGAAVLVAGGPVAAFASALGLAAVGSVLMARVAQGFGTGRRAAGRGGGQRGRFAAGTLNRPAAQPNSQAPEAP